MHRQVSLALTLAAALAVSGLRASVVRVVRVLDHPGTPKTSRGPAPAPQHDARGRIDRRFEERHRENLARAAAGPVGILFLGDSITEGWFWGETRKLWNERFGGRAPANFGIGGDRIEHLLWRIEHGELDRVRPDTVVLMIGTNNIGDPAEEMRDGVLAVVRRVRGKLPDSRLVIMAILPRGADPKDPTVASMRRKIEIVNRSLAALGDGKDVVCLDLAPRLMNADGTLSSDLFPDALHLSERAYRIWADALGPLLADRRHASVR